MELNHETLSGPAAELYAELAKAALPSLRLSSTGACDPGATGTRLGGLALVGPEFVWPRIASGKPLSLVGQLNCDEMNAELGVQVLPPDTLLAFFYEADGQAAWGFDPKDAEYWRVVATEIAVAQPFPTPQGALTFQSLALEPTRVSTVPDPWEPVMESLWQADRATFDDLYAQLELTGDQTGDQTRHRVFGWPEPVQNAMQLECQLASNGIYVGDPKGYRDPRAKELEAGAADWVLLWQIDSDDDAGWIWGDSGTIYYWIRRQDLSERKFDRVWMVFQCC